MSDPEVEIEAVCEVHRGSGRLVVRREGDRVVLEALVKLFLDNADRGCHAENDVFVEELLNRRRAIQALANPSGE